MTSFSNQHPTLSDSALYHSGPAAPLDKANVDTDQIIPKQFLTSVSREGFGEALFYDWRYLAKDASNTPTPNPDFVLNAPVYKGASILVTQDNFGCGSSREHAPWALQQYGFEVIIAPSFADIFFNNCVNNQMLPITLPADDIKALLEVLSVHTSTLGQTAQKAVRLDINLQEQWISVSNLDELSSSPSQTRWTFEIQNDIKNTLIAGLDFIDTTLQHEEEIKRFESSLAEQKPWL